MEPQDIDEYVRVLASSNDEALRLEILSGGCPPIATVRNVGFDPPQLMLQVVLEEYHPSTFECPDQLVGWVLEVATTEPVDSANVTVTISRR